MMDRHLNEDCVFCWALPTQPCRSLGDDKLMTPATHFGTRGNVGAPSYRKYGPPRNRAPLGLPCPHCRVDAGVVCWVSGTVFRDNDGYHACRRAGVFCGNIDQERWPEDFAPESERHLRVEYTFDGIPVFKSLNLAKAEDSCFPITAGPPLNITDDTETLMIAMTHAGRFLATRYEAAAIQKMLAGQREHGAGKWRTVDLFRYAADEPLDMRNYAALLVERGEMNIDTANQITQKAEEILRLLEQAKGGTIL